MTDQKVDPVSQMQNVARRIQQTLSQHGDPIAMGTAPSVVVFQANPNPAAPEAERMWHAAIVYRQHIAPEPARALASLGKTIFEAAARLEAQSSDSGGGEGPVKESPGGEVMLPEVWE